jgi:hypothetical protein
MGISMSLLGAKMREVKVDKGEQTEERIDQGRREAVMRLAKYTAPAMLAVLLSVDQAGATPCIPTSIMKCPG